MIDIPGLIYCPDLLGEQEQKDVLAKIDQQPWLNDLKRRVQHYGYRYNYKERSVDYSMYLGELPDFALFVSQRLLDKGLIEVQPDQAIVNEYLPGQGISAHIDCQPCFKDTIVTVSFGWAYPMEFLKYSIDDDFINKYGSTKAIKELLLETGSALVISGEARYEWYHQIRQRKKDNGVKRERRVSLTFRNVILADKNGSSN